MEMSKEGQDVDPSKTANDVFKMRYGVPIQGVNFGAKWVVKPSGGSYVASSQREWPKPSSVVPTKTNKQGEARVMKASKDEVNEPVVSTK